MKTLAILLKNFLLVSVLLTLVACKPSEVKPPADQGSNAALSAPIVTPEYLPEVKDKVSLSQGSITLTEHSKTLKETGRITDLDGDTLVNQTFETWVLENQFLIVTLVPEYGGRIISIVNKSTGNEQLYRNPVATPYGLNSGFFLYDWLQVWGGIFPTFGPEHGKAWFLPWDFEIVTNTDEEITIVMKWKDDFTTNTPPNFSRYELNTNLELSFFVTLKAGRQAVDTRIEIFNGGEYDESYEYWTNVGLAPGSDPSDIRATAGAEIIYPLDKVSTAWCVQESKCRKTISVENEASGRGNYYFEQLRHFKNWQNWGIMYAEPDMQFQNFWGVINQDNKEGLIRIADNSFTKGMKFWTFGYDSSKDIDPFSETRDTNRTYYYFRPFIELWAGNVPEFFRAKEILIGETQQQSEVYAVTEGLEGVTHANDNFLVDMRLEGEKIKASVLALYPDQEYKVRLSQMGDGSATEEMLASKDGSVAELESAFNPEAGALKLEIFSTDGDKLFTTVQ